MKNFFFYFQESLKVSNIRNLKEDHLKLKIDIYRWPNLVFFFLTQYHKQWANVGYCHFEHSLSPSVFICQTLKWDLAILQIPSTREWPHGAGCHRLRGDVCLTDTVSPDELNLPTSTDLENQNGTISSSSPSQVHSLWAQKTGCCHFGNFTWLLIFVCLGFMLAFDFFASYDWLTVRG